jgi:hypothetical protein
MTDRRQSGALFLRLARKGFQPSNGPEEAGLLQVMESVIALSLEVAAN